MGQGTNLLHALLAAYRMWLVEEGIRAACRPIATDCNKAKASNLDVSGKRFPNSLPLIVCHVETRSR